MKGKLLLRDNGYLGCKRSVISVPVDDVMKLKDQQGVSLLIKAGHHQNICGEP